MVYVGASVKLKVLLLYCMSAREFVVWLWMGGRAGE